MRLAELVGGLCVVSDLGKGLTDGQGLRTCVLAMDLAELLGLPAEERQATFWIGLLRFVGCTATASEMAAALGDELAVSAAFAAADVHDLQDVLRGAITAVGARPDRLLGFLMRSRAVVREHEVASCEVAQQVARALELPESVSTGVGQVFERWDGKGNPGRHGGADLTRPVRVWQVAHIADLVRAGADPAAAAAAQLRHRAGGALDPDIAVVAAGAIEQLFDRRAATGMLSEVLAAEPAPRRIVAADRIDSVLSVFGLLADLKSPHFRGHSDRVSALAAAAAEVAGRSRDEVQAIRRAGLVHDVGRVAVSSRIWDRAGPLSDGEREQVEMHPYYTQRVLARVPALSDLAELACSHHERCDGSGYHRALAGSAALSPLATLLAAADRYVSAGESRPHRPPCSDEARSALLRGDVTAGRLPGAAVDAVLAARRAPPRPPFESRRG